MSSLRATYLLIVLNVAVYALMLAATGGHELRHFTPHTLLVFGANYGPLVLEGQLFRLFTACFIHITPEHVAMNMVALWQVGRGIEPVCGRGRFVVLYLLAGLAGSVGSLVYNLHHPVVSAGASGAISGLIGAGIVIGQLLGTPQGERFRNMMIGWLALTILYGKMVHADNAAHLGGAIAGALLAYLLVRGRIARGTAERRVSDQRPRWVEAVVLVSLVLAVGSGFALAARVRSTAMSSADLVNRGVDLHREGKPDEAMAAYARAVKLDPTDATAHFDLALELLGHARYAEAESEAKRATELEPNNGKAYRLLGDILSAEGRPTDSAAAFDRAKALGDLL